MKKNLLNLFAVIFLLGCLFNACSDDDNTIVLPKERSYVKYTFQDSAFVMYKSLQGSVDGGVETRDTTYFYDELYLLSTKLHDIAKGATYTFIDDTDSVYVTGIIYLQSKKQINQIMTAVDKGFKYKFEDGQLMVFYDDIITEINGIGNYVDWLTIGYGDKEKFSIYRETKALYGTLSGSSSAESMQFLNPSSIKGEDEYTWDKFFNETSGWDWYNWGSIEELPENYRGFWNIFRYDFAPEKKDSET